MPFVLPENVQETSTTTGTGQLTLAGAVSGALEFDSQLANNDTTYYAISDGTDLEVGIGTFTNSAGNKLTRDTILYSTGASPFNWGAGTRNVFSGLPGTAIGSLLDPSGTGLLARTAANTYARRTLTAGTGITVTDGDGIAGDPTIAFGDAPKVHATEYLQTTSNILNGNPISVFRFIDPTKHAGIIARTNTDDHAAAFGTAILAAGHIEVPDGKYFIDSLLTINKDFRLIGQGKPHLAFRTTGSCIVVGDASYLTNDTLGNLFVDIKSLFIDDVNDTAQKLVHGMGVRTVKLDNLHLFRGVNSIYMQEAWAASSVSGCRAQIARGTGIVLMDECNNFKITGSASLGNAGGGFLIDGSTVSNKGITLDTIDVEGNTGVGVDIVGNIGAIKLVNGFFESNGTANVRVQNSVANVNGFEMSSTYLFDGDVLIGTGTGLVGLVKGVFLGGGNEFVNSDLIVIGNDRVSGVYLPQVLNGTSTETIPTDSALSAVTTVTRNIIPQARYSSNPTTPWGYGAGGMVGDIRYSENNMSVRTDAGWLFIQAQRINTATGASQVLEPLPTGSSPDVTGLKTCTTGNSGSTTVTSFSNGHGSQELIIIGLDGGNTIIANNSTIKLKGGIAITMSDFQTLHLVSHNGAIWMEV